MGKNKTVMFMLGMLLLSSNVMALEITPKDKANAEKAIASCETRYQSTKNLRSQFDQVQEPKLLSSTNTKKAYKDLALNKAAYDNQMIDFARFTNEKIYIRTAETANVLLDKVRAYSSNCSRFAEGISEFVRWATQGYPKVEKGPALIILFKDWQDDARSKVRK